MSVKISFADLTHMGQVVAANFIPLGISYVAAYAQQELGDEINLDIFKYPDDLDDYLDSGFPQIACFSSYSWAVQLNYEFARRIKEISPGTITVFGGPNFPATNHEQQEFLESHPAIDCYVEFEGEKAVVALFNSLKTFNFDWSRFSHARTVTSNLRYLVDGELIAGNLEPKTRELDEYPSPYLNGLNDKFFDDMLIPVLQSTRGCPYTCTFCWEGGDYFQKTIRFSRERIDKELKYMADRINIVPDLCIVDANYGMFKEDVETARVIYDLKQNHPHSWPKSIIGATAKNHKERTTEIVEILGEVIPPKASVQSTDDDILKAIRRKNVSLDAIMTMAKAVVQGVGGQSESEIILCLEGDSKRAHFKSVTDMLDAQMTFIRMYQCMLLPGTQSSLKENQAKYKMETRFRVLPRCFGEYNIQGHTIPVADIEEIVVANSTMPYQDYQDCRDFDLSVEIFNNDSILLDLVSFLVRHDVTRSEFILAAHDQIVNGEGVLPQLYTQFREEEKGNLWNTREELEIFIQQPGVIDRYIEGEYGTNELYKYRALAVFHHIEALHDVAYEVAKNLLKQREAYTDSVADYLSELRQFSLMRKRDILDTNQTKRQTFRYDFARLMENKFMIDPFEVYSPEGIEVEVYHSEKQLDLIGGYLNQYGDSLIGLGRILIRANMNRLYRSARSANMELPATSPEILRENTQLHSNLSQI